MSFQGTFNTFSVLDLVALVNQWRLSGVLTVIRASGERGLVFHEGDIVYATASEESRRLGSFLVRLGFMTPDEITAAGDLSPFAPGHFGQKLLKAGGISPPQLREAVKAQVFDVLNEIVAWEDAAFFFDDQPLPFCAALEEPLPAASVILEAAKRADDCKYAKSLFPEGNVVFDREFSSSAMEIEPRHAEVFALADGTRTVDQILFACHQGPRAAAAALRALVDRGLVRRTAVRIVKGGVPVVPDIVRTVVAPGTPVTIFGIFQAREIQRPRVGKLLSHEPLLTAKLLKLLTLGNMRLERSDLSINRLVERLGSFQTRCLLLPEAVRNLHYPQEEFYWRECWQHDQMCAQLCEQIARKTNYPYPGEAFLAGLLHNIGVYLLMSANPRAYRCLAMESLTRQVHMEDIEEKHFGISHTRIGGVYAKKWQFPPALRMAIREHHTADTSAGRTLAHILHVAEAIAQQLGCRVGFTPIDRRRFRDALATLGLNDKVLVSLVAAHQRKIMEPILEIIKPAG